MNKGRLCGVQGCSKYHNPLLHPYNSRPIAQFILKDLIDSLVLDIESKRAEDKRVADANKKSNSKKIPSLLSLILPTW